mmetsp:Transcript_40274/g.113885  ORF Transcript_40274/g.113885 Transcript_40274/m.113885 type:complete len:309 (+) Transcript_40274:102-1028(+)
MFTKFRMVLLAWLLAMVLSGNHIYDEADDAAVCMLQKSFARKGTWQKTIKKDGNVSNVERPSRTASVRPIPWDMTQLSLVDKNAHGEFPDFPFSEPYPELLEHEYALPRGSGCGTRPDIPRNASAPASTFLAPGNGSDPGWNGFCEWGWTLCPDAAANHDYSYYWRGLGPEFVNQAGQADLDKHYCSSNGFLKPDIARIVRNFEALRAKGEELCREKFNNVTVDGELYPLDNLTILNMETESMRLYTEGSSVNESSALAAAWNCIMGDLSCDLAYCNYAYCEKPDGTLGVMGECEGWDAVRGMPALYS